MYSRRLLPTLDSVRKRSSRLLVSRKASVVPTITTTTTTTTRYHDDNNDSLSTTLVVSTILPDATASAAGVRTQALLDGLAGISKTVHMTTTTTSSLSSIRDQGQHASTVSASAQDIIQDLARRGITWSWLPSNQSTKIHELTTRLPRIDRIIFDRFYVEESFSFALRKEYPEASLVLDMQDMHTLRGERETLVKNWDARYHHTLRSTSSMEEEEDCFGVLPAVMEHVPTTDCDKLLRELGSIHRSDLTLVCSPYEMELLTTSYGVDPSKLCLAPFFVAPEQIRSTRRSVPLSPPPVIPASFVFCGGFKHAPNVDAVRLLLQVIWPRIRNNLPTATLHIHGAYCPVSIRNSHNPTKTGVHIHGYTSDLENVFGPPGTSILLAPLRFGAGIKGKIIDAWCFGMPVVTTPVGSEGLIPLGGDDESTITFGGHVAWSVQEFVTAALDLASDRSRYDDAVRRGQQILKSTQAKGLNWAVVEAALAKTENDLPSRRKHDYTRALLWHHTARSTEFFSRWIELKETVKKKEEDGSNP